MLVGEVFARIGLDSKQYEKDLSRLEGVTRREATTLGAIFKNAFSVALGIGVSEAVKRGFQTIASTAISFNAQMEQARIGFTTMLGSAERADKFLRDVADFAARTPFEFPELLDAAKRMLAYGFAAEDVLPTMEAVGNASAAVGLGAAGINRIILALGQMRAKGKLSAEEMRQLTETGIPAWEILAEAMNKTTAEIMDMQQKGLIPAHDAIQIIIEGMNKRFPGMMKKMENTWEGVTSTIKDVWRMTIGTMTASWFNGLKTWLQGVRDWAVDFYNVLQSQGLRAALTHSFGAEFTSAVYLAGSVLRGFYNILVYVVALVRRHWQLIKFAGTAMLTYAAATKAAAAATSLFVFAQQLLSGNLTANTGLLGFLSNVIVYYRVLMLEAGVSTNIFTGALMRLRAALYAVHTALGPIGWVLIGLSLLVAGGLHLWNKYTQSLQKTPKLSNKVKDSTEAVNKAINDQADALKAAGKAAAKNLQPFDEINQLQKEMATGTDYLDAINEALDLDAAGISVPPVDFDDFLESLEEIKPSFSGFLEWLWDEWEGWVQSWGWVDTLAGWIVETFYDAEEGVWSLKKAWDTWMETVSNWGWVQTLSDWIVETFYNAEEGVWSLEKAWNTLTETISSWGWVQTLAGWIGDVKGKWEGFKSWAGRLWDEIKIKWDTFKTSVQKKWETLWEPVKLKWNSFVAWARGIWDGLLKKWNEIKSWPLWKWISDKVNWLKNIFNFKWSLPKIKLPRFTVSWSTAGFWGSVGKFLGLPGKPIIDVTWLAKGGILTRPTLFGGGEAGPEAVIPLTGSVFDDLAGRLAAALQKTQLAGAGAGGGDIYVYIGNEQVDAYVYRSQDRRNIRSNGR